MTCRYQQTEKVDEKNT